MPMFIRRFLTDPGNDVLLEIESVNILDLEPPSSITGVGTGTVCIVGEFADGPFNTPTDISSATDLQSEFGSVGYTYNGVSGNNPMARARNADAAVLAENWNGNAMIQLSGKKFSRLQVVRADNNVGSVNFTLLASLIGSAAFAYALVTGQFISISVNGAGPTSATFTGAVATVVGAAGTFVMASGDTVVLGYDAATNFTTTFLVTDNTVNLVVARINQAAGFTFASVNAGQIQLTGRQGGTGGQVRVVSGSAGVIVVLGLTVANTAGTGNVANIGAVSPTEIKTIVEAAVAGSLVETLSDGRLRLASTNSTIRVHTTTTADALGFAESAVATAAVVPTTGSIPAGTVVKPAAGGATAKFTTMQTIQFTPSGVFIGGLQQSAASGPWAVKIRHGLDDGTGIAALAGTINTVETVIATAAFSVLNTLNASAALSEAAIDVAYQTALDSTLDPNAVTRECNIIYSARQSNLVRRALRQNALDASANGLFGRVTIVRPPLGTTKTAAKSTVAEPGVGATRDQRVIYTWPGVSTFVPVIAQRGSAGGVGFTATGNVDVGADGFLASVLSQLAPEENPGQLTSFTGAINSFDSLAVAQGLLTVTDYIAFKAAGICALRMDDGTAIFQSGVTSVDPLITPSLVRISRRRMADYIQDTLARRAKGFGKKLSTAVRRKALSGEIRQFLIGLLAANNPGTQRISGFTVDDKTANTPELLAAGMFRIIANVRTLSSLDSIVIATTVGESVQVEESLPAAA